jgi:hypothetical protein
MHISMVVPREPVRAAKEDSHTILGGVIGGTSEMADLRCDMARWTLLALELAFLKPRGLMDSDKGREHLLLNSLLKEGEWECLVGGDRHTTALFWIQMANVRLLRAGHVTPAEFGTLDSAVTGMRAQANDLMSCLDRDIPYPYGSLVGTLVNINLFLMSTWKGLQLSLDYCGPAPWSTTKCSEPNLAWVWTAKLVLLLFWNTSYAAMFDLAKVMHSPFGDRRIDVAHEAIAGGIRKLADQLVNAHAALPPSMIPDACARTAGSNGSSAKASNHRKPNAFALNPESGSEM